jgi:hypothetical protein
LIGGVGIEGDGAWLCYRMTGSPFFCVHDPELRILASVLRSGQHPAAQEVEPGTPVHGALDDLQILWGVRQATGLWHDRCLTRTRVPHGPAVRSDQAARRPRSR